MKKILIGLGYMIIVPLIVIITVLLLALPAYIAQISGNKLWFLCYAPIVLLLSYNIGDAILKLKANKNK